MRLLPVLLLALLPSAALACRTASTGAGCAVAPVRVAAVQAVPEAPPLAQVGDVLPRGRYSLLLNAEYYGLPPARDGWVYMRVGRDAFRVDWASHQVLERVTSQTAANF